MSAEQIPSSVYVRVLETNEEADLGNYQTSANIELVHGVLTYFKKGTAGGSETLKINIYANTSADAEPIASSNTISVSDLTAGTNVYGTIRFDFSNVNLDKNISYFFRLESANYTRNGDTFYISWVYDWPARINFGSSDNRTGAQLSLIGNLF